MVSGKNLSDELSSPKYRAIMCDPPWGFSNTSTRAFAESHYITMSQEDIFNFTVIQKLAADDCVLFLWSPNAFTKCAIDTMVNWGWRFILPIPWIKMKPNSLGQFKLQIGLGNYFRNCTEMLIFGMRGKVRPKMRNIPNIILAPRTKYHSQKPDAAYELVERYTDGPYLDMFARYTRPGWDVWGYEVDEDIHLINNEWVRVKDDDDLNA